MRRIICILMCLSMASMVSALSITNGDFEALGIREDIPSWFDDEGGDTYIRFRYSPNGTQYMGMRNDDNDCWVYQSLGVNTGGVAALEIQFEIGGLDLEISPDNEDPPDTPLELVLTVSIYESDGSFVGSDGDDSDIDGADGVTELDSVTVSYPRMENGEFVTDSVTLEYLGTATGELFLRFENAGDDDDDTDDRFSIDNIQIVELEQSIVSRLPRDGTNLVAVELTSDENDLIFDIVDEDISVIDVLFAADDPNFAAEDKIVNGDEIMTTGQYVVTLEDLDLPDDRLEWGTNYYWQVRAYEPNGMEVSLKYESPVWDYRTIQEGPLLGTVDPNKLYVHPEEDAVFTVDFVSNADALQWYKYGVGALTNGPDYAGVDTDTLTVLDCQLEDEGFYYCIGTQTSSGKTDRTDNNAHLKVKQLMTYYPFEETFTEGGKIYTPDVEGGKHMELKNGASLSDVNSLMGNHLWLNNPGNQYAQIADNTVAHYEDITISFWCFATTLDDDIDEDRWARIFDFGKDSTEYIFFTMLYRQDSDRQNGNDVMRCEMRYFNDDNESQNPELDVEGQFEAGIWYHVAITIEADEDGEGGSGRIYVGGQHGTEAETPQMLNLPKLTEIEKTIHYLGKGIGFTPPLFNGRIDEFKIYNYAKTSEEIAQEYLDETGEESLCNFELYDLYDYDFDNSCKIDLPDFAEIAAHWLEDFIVLPD